MRPLVFCALAMLFVALPARGQEKEILKTTAWGSLTGKVTFDGDLPKPASLVPQILKLMDPVDRACCNAAPAKQKLDPTWVIDPKTKGVANVVVWVKAPEGKVLPIHFMDKKRKDTVVLDQPFCAFVPHVTALYPAYHNGKEMVPTGQKFLVKNSAIVSHNVRGTAKQGFNESFNINMPAKTEREFSFKPQPIPILVQCDLHTFMKAHIFVFDHPCFAVTKEDGTFTIPRVPAGAEITIMAWHSEKGTDALAREGKKVTLKEGANEFNFSVK